MSEAAKKSAATIQEGDKAPNFNLPTDNEGKASLDDLKGKNVVLYFYPKDDTPGCTIEAKDFRDNLGAFEKLNTIILGISKDSCAKHDKFKNKHELNFALISDEEGNMCEDYGVWVEKNMYGKKYMGIQRATFLINADGTVVKTWPKVKVAGHVDEVLEAAKQL